MFVQISYLMLLPTIQLPAAAQTPAKPLPFPWPSEFPLNPVRIHGMIGAGDTAGLRRHGWFLWAGINQPGRAGWPIWRSWPIATQAFAPNPAVPFMADEDPAAAPVSTQVALAATPQGGASLLRKNLENNPPINLAIPFYLIPEPVRTKHREALKDITLSAKIPDGENFQNNGDLMLVSEAYNEAAFAWIRQQKLYDKSTLANLFRKGDKSIGLFPNNAMVLKHMYWPVKKDGLTALPVADMTKYKTSADPDTTYVGFENKARWPRAVAIDPTSRAIPEGESRSVTYLYDVQTAERGHALGPHTYNATSVVPLSRFYYRILRQADYDAMSTYDKVLIDASFYWVHGRMFEDGDSLAAVASHLITQESQYWTLQTFWWHDRPDETEYATDRPDIAYAQGPWRHYLMNLDDGVAPPPGSDQLQIVYNPYIELASHPVVTNCRNCHTRAAWPEGQYMTKSGPGALVDIKPGNPTFQNQLRTNFLWTIPDRAN